MAATAETLVALHSRSPTLPPATVFPGYGMQILSSAITLLGLTVVTYCFARRTDYEGIWSLRGLQEISWPRLCVSLLFLDSWAFIFSSGLLTSGVGLSTNQLNCTLAIFTCILFYACSKLLIYLFLAEKVYIVWAPRGTIRPPRLKTPIFRFCIILMLPFVGVLVAMLLGRVAELRADRVCVIGLRKASSLILLSYDLFTTAVLNGLFIWPLLTANMSLRVRKVAARTLIASLAALTTSCVNIAVLTILHGRELGWICLSSCAGDVTLNAIAIYWVTNNQHQTSRPISKNVEIPQEHPARHFSGSASCSTDELGTKSPTNVRLPVAMTVSSGSRVDGIAPETPPGARRITHFAEEHRGSRFTSDKRVEGRGAKTGGLFSGIKDALRAKDTPVEEHVMSVQVTVTTEHRLPADELDEAKYDHGSDSDIATAMSKERSKAYWLEDAGADS